MTRNTKLYVGLGMGILLVSLILLNNNPIKPPEKIKIVPRLDGHIIGSLDQNLARTNGLHPCAKDEPEARQILNQLISFSKCAKDGLKCTDGTGKIVTELLSDEQIDTNFELSHIGNFYEIKRIGSDFNFYLQASRNPEYMLEIPDTLYICSADYLTYLNTDYGDQYSYAYYPYPIEADAIDAYRELKVSYLQNPQLGLAKVADSVLVDQLFLEDFTNLLYEIGYFTLGGFNTKGRIIDREFQDTPETLIIRDQIFREAFNDVMNYVPLFNTTRFYYEYRISYNKQTRVIVAEQNKL